MTSLLNILSNLTNILDEQYTLRWSRWSKQPHMAKKKKKKQIRTKLNQTQGTRLTTKIYRTITDKKINKKKAIIAVNDAATRVLCTLK